MLAVGFRVAVQVTPSLLLRLLRLPFATVKSPISSPVTASLKVMMTVELSPTASAGRIAVEIFALLIWNDVHFWINHRLLHTRRLVRYHGDHHRSVVTTPWSTYSFHPIEALMLGNIILLPMLVHDFYFWSLASVPVLSLILNLIGHSNYDFFPSVPDTHPLAASRRHHLHHARPAGNYGFALAFMDQLMRTRVADNTPKSSSH